MRWTNLRRGRGCRAKAPNIEDKKKPAESGPKDYFLGEIVETR
jgi:hypothetical protein